MSVNPTKRTGQLLERIHERPSTFAELAAYFDMPTARQRKDLFDSLALLLARGAVLRIGDRGHYVYATERPALPAIDLQPVPVLTVSLGVVVARAA